MSEVSFPGPGPDGEQPSPGTEARDEAAGMPAGVPEDDWDGDAAMAAYFADLDAGRGGERTAGRCRLPWPIRTGNFRREDERAREWSRSGR